MNLPILEIKPPKTLRAQFLEGIEILITDTSLDIETEKRVGK